MLKCFNGLLFLKLCWHIRLSPKAYYGVFKQIVKNLPIKIYSQNWVCPWHNLLHVTLKWKLLQYTISIIHPFALIISFSFSLLVLQNYKHLNCRRHLFNEVSSKFDCVASYHWLVSYKPYAWYEATQVTMLRQWTSDIFPRHCHSTMAIRYLLYICLFSTGASVARVA